MHPWLTLREMKDSIFCPDIKKKGLKATATLHQVVNVQTQAFVGSEFFPIFNFHGRKARGKLIAIKMGNDTRAQFRTARRELHKLRGISMHQWGRALQGYLQHFDRFLTF